MHYFDMAKNFANNMTQEIGKKLAPPPEKDVFQENGELSPNEFKQAGDHLVKICTDWQWKPSLNPKYQSKYLPEAQQYLVLENNLCKRRLNTNLEEKPLLKIEEKPIIEGEDDIIVLEGGETEVEKEN
jgi:ubiquitin-like-conjugating enzyme ATG3